MRPLGLQLTAISEPDLPLLEVVEVQKHEVDQAEGPVQAEIYSAVLFHPGLVEGRAERFQGEYRRAAVFQR